MDTQEIPHEQWPQYLDQFSRLHRGKAARVHTADPEVGFQANAEGLPLIGLSDDHPGRPDETIRVMLGGDSGTHVDHAVPRPAHVRVTEWNDGYSAALQIESSDGDMTLVQVGPQGQGLPEGFITDGLLR
jgi:hypothetical protein